LQRWTGGNGRIIGRNIVRRSEKDAIDMLDKIVKIYPGERLACWRLTRRGDEVALSDHAARARNRRLKGWPAADTLHREISYGLGVGKDSDVAGTRRRRHKDG
jgi:hypothetical protein